MAVPKIIPYNVELRSVNPVRSFDRPKAYTNDLNSVEFQFKILDMTSIELNTATAITLVYMRDGSFFANPSTDVERVGNVFSYLLKENEGNHAGVAQIQLVVTIDDAEFASQLFDFEIINGLETKVAQEVMIYDWTTLTRDARAYIDQFVADELLRDAEFDNAQFDRNVEFVGSQESRALAFGVEQTDRGAAFTTEQTDRNTAFNNAQDARALTFSESESGRTTAETGRVTAESNRVTAESGRVTKESQRVTAESSRVTAEGNRVTAENARVTAETNRAAAFTAFDTRLTAEEIATAANKISAVKGKTFVDVDARLEDVEFDTATMGTNLVTNGDFSNGTVGWTSPNSALEVSSGVCTLTTNTNPGQAKTIITTFLNAKHYVSALVKASTNLVSLGIINDSPPYTPYGVKIHSGSNSFERLSFVATVTENIQNARVRIIDTNAATPSICYVDNVLSINLTQTFGKGNEPTAEQMDAIMAKFENSWFDGTKNLFRANATLNKLMAVDARTEFEAKNEVANGDFSNGTTGWSASNSTLSTANNTLSVTSDGTASNPRVNQVAIDMNRKYYVRLKYRVTNPNCLTMMAYIGIDNIYLSSINSPVENQWYTPSGILTSFGLGKRAFFISHAYSDAATALGKVMEVQYVQAIDLTAAFGAGKEPTLAEMDRLMARFPNSWFDGVKPIQTIETLYQEKANKVQEAWITPTLLNGWTHENVSYPASYYKDELGVVRLKNLVKGGTLGTVAFTLPIGYRPSPTKYFAVISAATTLGYVTVSSGGNVTIVSGNLTFVALDNISFRAEG